MIVLFICDFVFLVLAIVGTFGEGVCEVVAAARRALREARQRRYDEAQRRRPRVADGPYR